MATASDFVTPVTNLYVALFNRVPDTEGLRFWADAMANGASLDTITQSFLTAPEGTDTYSPFLSSEDFVADFYATVFGRPADAGGLAFWTAALDNWGGAASIEARAKLVAAIVEIVSTPMGAQPADMDDEAYAQTVADRATFANKVLVGEYFGASLTTTIDVAKGLDISTIDDTAASVDAVKQQAFSSIGAGATVVGTSYDDVFSVDAAVFTTGTIDGKGGNDTLYLSNANEVAANRFSNIETVVLTSLANGATVDASVFAGATAIKVGNSAEASITGMLNKSLTLTGVTGTDDVLTVEYADQVVAANVILANDPTSVGTLVALTGEKLAAVTLSGTGAVVIDADSSITLKTLNVATAGTVAIDVSLAPALTLVDASRATGTVSIDLGTTSGYTGGSGIDKVMLTVVNTNTITGGAGDADVLYAATAAVLNASTKVSGFEILDLTRAANSDDPADTAPDAGTYYGVKGFKSIVAGNDSNDGFFVVTGADAGTTLSYASDAKVVYRLADASGTADALTVDMTNGGYTNASLTAAGIESFTVNVDAPVREDGKITITAPVGSSLSLTAADAISVVVRGEGDFTLYASDDNTKLTSVDATGLTAGTFRFESANDTLGANVTIKGTLVGENHLGGGAANDTITGGAGDDTITSGTGLDVVTGGEGADTFRLSANANSQVYTTIADFDQTDVIDLNSLVQLKDAPEFTHLTLAGTATLNDYIDAAVNKAVAGATATDDVSGVSWFNFGGDTYIVVDNNAAATAFVDGVVGGDQIVKLTGTIDLSSVNYVGEQISFSDAIVHAG